MVRRLNLFRRRAWDAEVHVIGGCHAPLVYPAHRRIGLARAVCLDAARALKEAGATLAQVGYSREAAHRTYLSAGFANAGVDLSYIRATVAGKLL